MLRTLAGSLVLAILAVIESQASESTSNVLLTGEAEAKVERNGPIAYLATRSHGYELTQYAHGNQVQTALVETQVRHRRQLTEDLGANGTETGSIELSVHPLDAHGALGSLSATRVLGGDEYVVQGSAGIRIVTWGCCVQSNGETQLSPHSLATLYVKSSQMPLLTYTRLGTPTTTRVAAVYAAMTPLDDEVLGKDASVVALVTWAADTGPLQRIRVHFKAENPRESALSWMSDIGWQAGDGSLSSHAVYDPDHPQSLRLVWQIETGRTIELQLTGDRFDTASATQIPEGVWLDEIQE